MSGPGAAPTAPGNPAVADGPAVLAAGAAALAARIDAALPQTQCTRCGYPDCRRYAEAIAVDGAPINRCAPGGQEGVARLSALTGRPPQPLDPAHGREGPRRLARIDESWCIGCTLCLKACPVDCIVGASQRMHTVIEPLCTGCERCLPVCPVDCIEMLPTGDDATGWAAWSDPQAAQARARYAWHVERLARDEAESAERLSRQARADRPAAIAEAAGGAVTATVPPAAGAPDDPQAAQRAAVEAALRRARQRRTAAGDGAPPPGGPAAGVAPALAPARAAPADLPASGAGAGAAGPRSCGSAQR